MRRKDLVPRLLLAGVLGGALWLGGACAQESGRAPNQTPLAREVVLEAELHHAGLVVLRSPTFR